MESTDTTGWSAHQVEDLKAAIAAAKAAIDAAATAEEINAALEALNAAAERIAASCPASAFVDVAEEDWFHDSVDYMVLSGLMNGISDTEFAPGMNTNRAQMVTVLYRAAGEPSVDGMSIPFEDVPAESFYTNAVIWAYNNGIVNGVTETVFAPGKDISREEMVTMLYRFAGKPEADVSVLNAYTDSASVSAYAVDAMAWAVGSGIVNGMTDTTLAPAGTTNRAQAATIMMRYLSK